MPEGRPIPLKDKIILIGGAIAIILLTIMVKQPGKHNIFWFSEAEHKAFDHMKSAMEEVSAYHNLIGPEISEITTTLGDRAAKQTTLHPAFASLIVRMLLDAGVRRGDTIALSCSGSFPGLLIASLSAAEALDIYPVTILSMGSSSYGASDPDFSILDLHMLLTKLEIVRHPPAAVSVGGDMDTGREMEREVRQMLIDKALDHDIPVINEENLVINRGIRDSVYHANQTGSVKAFINSGGGYAAMGTSSLTLLLKPGIVNKARMPPYESRGVIHDMLDKNIPVIHLLYIKGIATRYSIPWDS